jgi:RNA polymerase sigma factor (sigma-70 family)
MTKYTAEEEKALFTQAQAGDSTSLAKLMQAHEKLVHAVVRQQWSGGWRYADIVHEGRIGLWRAILHYDPERGGAFSTYAWPAIARQVWHAVEQAARHSEPAPAPMPMSATVDVAQHVAWLETCATLRALVARLPQKERWLLRRYYGLDGWGGQTQPELGSLLGCTRQAVSYHMHKALRRLRHPDWSAPLLAQLASPSRATYRAALRPPQGGLHV